MELKFFAIIGISIIVSGSIAVFYFAQNETHEGSNEIEMALDEYDFFYPEELSLRWTNEKIIQESDVIVLADLEKYENNQWVLGPNHLDIKGYTQGDEIKIDSIFSSFIPLVRLRNSCQSHKFICRFFKNLSKVQTKSSFRF